MATAAGALRPLLGLAQEDEQTLRLAREGGHAFVSSSLRAYVIAALSEIDDAARSRPTLVVVGDDRAARDLAADLRAWLAPRRVRYYPSRGVAVRVASGAAGAPGGAAGGGAGRAAGRGRHGAGAAAADAGASGAAAEAERAVVVVSAVALSEKVPDPQLRPHSFTLRVGELLDLDECAAELVERGLRARGPGRGARAVRDARRAAGRVPGDRGARGARGHVRRGDRVAALVLDVHAALAGRRSSEVEIAPAAELAARAPRARGDWRRSSCRRARTRSARTSPSCCRSSASARCWIWSGEDDAAGGRRRGGARSRR